MSQRLLRAALLAQLFACGHIKSSTNSALLDSDLTLKDLKGMLLFLRQPVVAEAGRSSTTIKSMKSMTRCVLVHKKLDQQITLNENFVFEIQSVAESEKINDRSEETVTVFRGADRLGMEMSEIRCFDITEHKKLKATSYQNLQNLLRFSK